MKVLLSLPLLLCSFQQVQSLGLVKQIYCGLETCYETLGVNRADMKVSEVRKIFRKMSQNMHPDNHVSEFNQGKISQDKWDEINDKFRILGIAYDTLKDKEKRKEYDHYLDHPEDRYYNYAKFYQAKFNTSVDMKVVIIGLILLWSALQYAAWTQQYNSSLAYRV